MLARQRQQLILAAVRQSGGVRISDLTEQLGVSDMTVRRDLDVLARRGALDKVHGGATVAQHSHGEEPGFLAKAMRERFEKEAIADAAAGLVKPGCTVGLSAGTTTWTLAERLSNTPDLTVVTNSLRIADAFGDGGAPRQTVILIGGVRTPSDALVGPIAEAAIAGLHFDLLFLGCHGISVKAGLTTPNISESQTSRALMDAAAQVVVVADSTKWETVGLMSFARLSEIDILVTDFGLAPQHRSAAAEHVGRLIVAEPSTGPGTGPSSGKVQT